MIRVMTVLSASLVVLTASATWAQTPPAEAPQQPGPRAARSTLVQGTLNIAAGERVVLKRGADGTFELLKAEFVGQDAALPPKTGDNAPLSSLMRAEPGTVAFTLGLRRDVGSFLKIENGLDKAFDYQGYVIRISEGKPQPPARTSICTVMAGKLGFEHWNQPVIQMVLGNLGTAEGELAVCEPESVSE